MQDLRFGHGLVHVLALDSRTTTVIHVAVTINTLFIISAVMSHSQFRRVKAYTEPCMA